VTGPLLHDDWFADLRVLQETGLKHRAVPVTLETIRLPNGEYDEVWVEGTEVPALFMVAGTEIAELAAVHGVRAVGVLKMKIAPALTEVGQLYRVRGIQRGTERLWELKVTADLDQGQARIIRRTLVEETEID
jgi:hypothetical protein